MKKCVLICLVASLSITANAQTVSDQLAGLQQAQIQEVEAGFFARGNIAVLVKSDGSLVPYLPFESQLSTKTIKAIRIGKLFAGRSEALHYLYVDSRFGDQHIQRDAGGSGGCTH